MTRLEGGRLEVRFPADQEFLLQNVQTDPRAHEASCAWAPEAKCAGAKRTGREDDHKPLSAAPQQTLSPQCDHIEVLSQVDKTVNSSLITTPALRSVDRFG